MVAALAVSHWVERQTGWSIKKFVQTLRRYRTVTIRAGNHTLTAADPLPADIQDVLATITTTAEAPATPAAAVRPPKVRTKLS